MADLTIVVQPQTALVVTRTPLVAEIIKIAGQQGPAGPSGLANIQWNEAPAGIINGTNVTFTLAYAPIGMILSLNGLIQNPGAGNDYTLSGNTITFNTLNTPHSGDIILATYTH